MDIELWVWYANVMFFHHGEGGAMNIAFSLGAFAFEAMGNETIIDARIGKFGDAAIIGFFDIV